MQYNCLYQTNCFVSNNTTNTTNTYSMKMSVKRLNLFFLISNMFFVCRIYAMRK